MTEKFLAYFFVSPQHGGGNKVDWMEVDCPDGYMQNRNTGECEEIIVNGLTGRPLMPHSKVNKNKMRIDTVDGRVYNPDKKKYEVFMFNDKKRLVRVEPEQQQEKKRFKKTNLTLKINKE